MFHPSRNILIPLIALAISPAFIHADEKAEKESEKIFREKVVAIFEVNCVKCHNAKVVKGKFALDTFEAAMKGGDSGEVIVPGESGQSLLVEQISGDKPAMPSKADPLTAEQVKAIRDWIDKGAIWPEGIKLMDRSKKKAE